MMDDLEGLCLFNIKKSHEFRNASEGGGGDGRPAKLFHAHTYIILTRRISGFYLSDDRLLLLFYFFFLF